MASAIRIRGLLTMFAMAVLGSGASPQISAQTTEPVEPTNDLPNPYRSIAPWGSPPEGKPWGALNGVAIDNDGRSVWVVSRCGANPEVPPGASAFTYI